MGQGSESIYVHRIQNNDSKTSKNIIAQQRSRKEKWQGMGGKIEGERETGSERMKKASLNFRVWTRIDRAEIQYRT